MIVAWSQTEDTGSVSIKALEQATLRGTRVYALTVPIFFALGGTLVGQIRGVYVRSSDIRPIGRDSDPQRFIHLTLGRAPETVDPDVARSSR